MYDPPPLRLRGQHFSWNNKLCVASPQDGSRYAGRSEKRFRCLPGRSELVGVGLSSSPRSIFIVHSARYDTVERQNGLSFYFRILVRNPRWQRCDPAVQHRNNADTHRSRTRNNTAALCSVEDFHARVRPFAGDLSPTPGYVFELLLLLLLAP